MSVIATINVHKCDGCGTIAVLHTEADCELFAEVWFAGIFVDFCSICRNKLQYQAAIETDEKSMNEMQRAHPIASLSVDRKEAAHA